jgi:hypothetical protein
MASGSRKLCNDDAGLGPQPRHVGLPLIFVRLPLPLRQLLSLLIRLIGVAHPSEVEAG